MFFFLYFDGFDLSIFDFLEFDMFDCFISSLFFPFVLTCLIVGCLNFGILTTKNAKDSF